MPSPSFHGGHGGDDVVDDRQQPGRNVNVNVNVKFNVDGIPWRPWLIVLGTSPGPLLQDRVETALRCWQQGCADRLLLSGTPHETAFMSAFFAGELSKSTTDRVMVDDGATRTLENVRRARDRYAVRRALVVSQRFHLPRVRAIAWRLGVDVVGIPALRAIGGRTLLREGSAWLRLVADQLQGKLS